MTEPIAGAEPAEHAELLGMDVAASQLEPGAAVGAPLTRAQLEAAIYSVGGYAPEQLVEALLEAQVRAGSEPGDSSLVAHAIAELELLGNDDAFNASIVNAVRSFVSYGHSGASAAFAAEMLARLVRWEPLSALTDDPAEWMPIDEDIAGEPNLFQSRRRPDAFSRDGGRTYRLLSEDRWEGPDDDRTLVKGPTHMSAPRR